MRELECPQQSVPKDRRFCTRCGEIKRLHYFEGDSAHCKACCEKMLHTHVRLWSVPVVLVMLLTVAAAVYLAVQTVPYAMQVRSAQVAVADGRLSEACDLYADAISSAQSGKPLQIENGLRVWEQYATVYADLNSEYEAAGIIRSALTQEQIAASPVLFGLQEARAAYEQTLEFVNSLNEKYALDTVEELPYEEMMRDLEAYADASDSRYVKGYIAYFKASATAYHMQDDPMAADVYYDEMLGYLPDEYMAVYTGKGDNAMEAKAYDKAVEVYEALLQKNSGSLTGWARLAEAALLSGDKEKSQQALAKLPDDDPQTYYMRVYLALRDDDLPGAQALCKQARAKFSEKATKAFSTMLAKREIGDEDAQFLTSYIDYNLIDAAVSLLTDDTKAAMDTAYEHGFNYAYYLSYITGDSSALTQRVINMASLCASLAKDADAQDTIAQCGVCDETTQQMISGKLSLREVFVEGKASIL